MTAATPNVVLIAPEILNNRAMPSVGVASIAAYLAARDVRVEVVDAQYTKSDATLFLRRRPPSVVGISIESRTLTRALRLARTARRHGHTVVAGGVHVSLVGARILEHEEIDYAIADDGELAMYELIGALSGRRTLGSVANLIFRQPDGTIVRNAMRNAPVEDLPIPDYRLAGIEHIEVYPVVTSRGCPYRCTFCTTGAVARGQYRARPPADVVAEIELARQRYGIRSFIVVDENFSFDIGRAKEFCRLLIERGVGLPWTVFEGVRADAVDHDLLHLLRASNCHWIFFGIETVENAVLQSVHKGTKFQRIERAVGLAREYGFKVGGFLIVGLPESTFASDLLAIEWALGHLDKATFWTAIPYHGTALHEWVLRHGRLLREPVDDNLVNTQSTAPFFDTPDYPARDRKRAHAIGNLRSGALYFAEYLDYELRRRLRPDRTAADHTRRRLIELACRYDPTFLSLLMPARAFRACADPLASAAEMPAEQAMPLPADLRGSLGTPIANVGREPASAPERSRA